MPDSEMRYDGGYDFTPETPYIANDATIRDSGMAVSADKYGNQYWPGQTPSVNTLASVNSTNKSNPYAYTPTVTGTNPYKVNAPPQDQAGNNLVKPRSIDPLTGDAAGRKLPTIAYPWATASKAFDPKMVNSLVDINSIKNRIPMLYMGPEWFFDPETGNSYRYGQKGGVRLAGNVGWGEPEDQLAAYSLWQAQQHGSTLPEAQASPHGKRFTGGGSIADLLPYDQMITPAMIQAAIKEQAGTVGMKARGWTGPASIFPRIGPIVGGTLGTVFAGPLGGMAGAAFESAATQAATRGGKVDWKGVGINAGVGLAGGLVGGGLNAATAAGPIISGAAGGAASAATRDTLSGKGITWQDIVGGALSGGAGGLSGSVIPYSGGPVSAATNWGWNTKYPPRQSNPYQDR